MKRLTFAHLVAVAVSMVHCASYRTIQTPSGPVRGIGVQDKAYQYRRIPYAKPPVGDLRLRKPIPYGRWTNTLDAARFGPSCYQSRTYLRPTLPNKELSEDCLHLNIYTPDTASLDNTKSVMVWIHGGAFLYEQASEFDASKLANLGDVIVVTLNYRLGILGFLSTMDSASPGNYGLWDQILAIKWVKNNIAAFGGKHDSITIFGQSAGSISVGLHALNPRNQGLFQRVIGESGAANSASSLTLEPKNIARGHGIALHCINENDVNFDTADLVQCVRGKSADDIIQVQESIDLSKYTRYVVSVTNGPVVDGDLIPRYPEEALANVSSAESSFFRSLDGIFGNTDAEGSILLDVYIRPLEKQLGFDASRAIPNSVLCNILSPEISKEFFNSDSAVAEAICKKYSSVNEGEQSRKILDLFTDALMVAPTIRTLDVHSSPGLTMGRNTFQYVFARESHVGFPAWFRGAQHGAELPYLFDDGHTGQLYNSALDEMLSIVMVTYWTNFAKHGTPNSRGLPHWPRYDPVGRLYMNLDATISPRYNFNSERILFWNRYLSSL